MKKRHSFIVSLLKTKSGSYFSVGAKAGNHVFHVGQGGKVKEVYWILPTMQYSVSLRRNGHIAGYTLATRHRKA